MSRTHLVVVGGGITGLAAAWEASADGDTDVTVVEAAPRWGGKLHTSNVDLPDGSALLIDEGADAFLARVPDAVALCRELGLGDELTQPAIGQAKLWLDGQLRDLPAETVLGVPTDLETLARANVLSPEGLSAVAAEWDRTGPGPDGDVAIGPFLTERFGPELVERVVAPLIGGINAGDVDELSLRAVTPQLAEAAADGDSLSRALARRRPPAGTEGPVFHALRGGSGRLVQALVDALTERGVTLRTDAPVQSLERDGDAWALTVGDEQLRADRVALCTPAPTTAALLAPLSAEASAGFAEMTHSAVALVTMIYRSDDVPGPLDASGVLVPRTAGMFLTAVSWGSSKWAHWNDGRHFVLRASAGRTGDERQAAMDDDALVGGLHADLVTIMGITGSPVGTRVARWPLGFTQYTVGHLDRVDAIEAALRRDCPGVVATGASMRGLGLPACIRKGREATRELLGT